MWALVLLAAMSASENQQLHTSLDHKAAVSIQETALPAGLSLTLRLTTFLDTGLAKVGDPLEAVLLRDAKMKGKVVVPKGARVRGRICVLARTEGQVIVGLEWSELRFDGTEARVVAKLEEMISELPGTARIETPSSRQPVYYSEETNAIIGGFVPGHNPIVENNLPGVGTFVVKSSPFKYRGLTMLWRTLPQ